MKEKRLHRSQSCEKVAGEYKGKSNQVLVSYHWLKWQEDLTNSAFSLPFVSHLMEANIIKYRNEHCLEPRLHCEHMRAPSQSCHLDNTGVIDQVICVPVIFSQSVILMSHRA